MNGVQNQNWVGGLTSESHALSNVLNCVICMICGLKMEKLKSKGLLWKTVAIMQILKYWDREGQGNPLQYSCLENSMDRGAWWTAVHGVAQSRTRQKQLSMHACVHWRRKWQPTPVFLPGESQGWRSLVGCHLWGCTESDTAEAT